MRSCPATANKPPEVVFIADRIPSHSSISIATPTLEFVSDSYYQAVLDALRLRFDRVTTYGSPAEFIDHIHQHKDAVILSLWSGKQSRNRRALVPSCCEAYAIRYVGPDAHSQLLAQDKAVAKRFATEHGLSTPLSILIRQPQDVPLLRALPLPVVVKPNFEGGSIGISESSLCECYAPAESLALRLLQVFDQPCLVEEFVPGREISIVVFGSRDGIRLIEALELNLPTADFDPLTQIYGFELKKDPGIIKTRRPCNSSIGSSTMQSVTALFQSLGKAEVLRVDGRLNSGTFQFIELTTDVSYEPDCYLAAAFARRGYSYPEMLEMIVSNARDRG